MDFHKPRLSFDLANYPKHLQSLLASESSVNRRYVGDRDENDTKLSLEARVNDEEKVSQI